MSFNRDEIEFEIGYLSVKQQGLPRQVRTSTMEGEDQNAKATQFVYKNAEGCAFLAALYEFENHPALFAGVNLLDGPAIYSRAVSAGRLEVREEGKEIYSCRIRALKCNEGDRFNLSKVSPSELTRLSRTNSAFDLLKSLGAEEIGTAEEILNESNRNKTQLAMIFPKNDLRALVAMWGITRLNALTYKFGLPEFEAQ